MAAHARRAQPSRSRQRRRRCRTRGARRGAASRRPKRLAAPNRRPAARHAAGNGQVARVPRSTSGSPISTRSSSASTRQTATRPSRASSPPTWISSPRSSRTASAPACSAIARTCGRRTTGMDKRLVFKLFGEKLNWRATMDLMIGRSLQLTLGAHGLPVTAFSINTGDHDQMVYLERSAHKWPWLTGDLLVLPAGGRRARLLPPEARHASRSAGTTPSTTSTTASSATSTASCSRSAATGSAACCASMPTSAC